MTVYRNEKGATPVIPDGASAEIAACEDAGTASSAPVPTRSAWRCAAG